MTALRRNIITPSDQRALQKIHRMSPDQMAILSSLMAPYMHERANQYAAKMIDLRSKAFEKQRGETELALGKERLESRKRTGEAKLGTERKIKEADIASQQALKMQSMERGAKRREREISSDEALKMQDVKGKREALPTTVAMGIGKLGIGALGGEVERRRNLDFQRKLEALMTKNPDTAGFGSSFGLVSPEGMTPEEMINLYNPPKTRYNPPT